MRSRRNTCCWSAATTRPMPRAPPLSSLGWSSSASGRPHGHRLALPSEAVTCEGARRRGAARDGPFAEPSHRRLHGEGQQLSMGWSRPPNGPARCRRSVRMWPSGCSRRGGRPLARVCVWERYTSAAPGPGRARAGWPTGWCSSATTPASGDLDRGPLRRARSASNRWRAGCREAAASDRPTGPGRRRTMAEGCGRPHAWDRRRRWPTWSDGCEMTARIPRRRRWLRMAHEEYARSARTVRDRVRQLPGPLRGTRMRDITVSERCITCLGLR